MKFGNTLVAALDVLGFSSLCWGLWQIYPAAAYIVGGGLLLVAAQRISARM